MQGVVGGLGWGTGRGFLTRNLKDGQDIVGG